MEALFARSLDLTMGQGPALNAKSGAFVMKREGAARW